MSDAWTEEKQAKLTSVLKQLGDVELERSKNFAIGGSVALMLFAEEIGTLIKPVEAMLSENGSKLVNTVLKDMITRAKLQHECLDKQADIAQSIQTKRKIDKIKASN